MHLPLSIRAAALSRLSCHIQRMLRLSAHEVVEVAASTDTTTRVRHFNSRRFAHSALVYIAVAPDKGKSVNT
jgi:hypothetical protein